MSASLDALFKPRSVAFIGGRSLAPVLEYHAALGFTGDTWVVHPTHKELAGFACAPSLAALPQAPELAFVAVPHEAAVEVVAELRSIGCRAVICHAAGFAETGAEGAARQEALVAAAGEMAMLGPNTLGLVNYADPMAAAMNHLGTQQVERGVAICAQGGGFMCDAVFCDRSLPVTHLVGGGNQAITGMEDCAEYLLEDARVSAVGMSFEGLRSVPTLRRAAVRALQLGKPLVVIKFGKTAAGARAAATHTASMAGEGARWEALFDRLGIISTNSESEFLETLKLLHHGKPPRGRRVLITAASGVMGVMLADHLSAAGFELPQPSAACAARLRKTLPQIATPANPQDVTMVAWNDQPRQQEVYTALLEEGQYDIAMMVQNYPNAVHAGMWDIKEYEAQVAALAGACAGREVTGLQVAPLVECFPPSARAHTLELGLAPMQGMEECAKALAHACGWRARRDALLAAPLPLEQVEQVDATPPTDVMQYDEALAKAKLAAAGVGVPAARVCAADADAVTAAAEELGCPVALKALDARLLHKSEVGAVRVNLPTPAEVAAAVEQMRAEMQQHAPHIALERVLVEAMVPDVVAEVMASVCMDAALGPVMLLASGGSEAELWNDRTVLAAPFAPEEIARALQRLRVARLLAGWRGRAAGDVPALLQLLHNLAAFALAEGVEEVEVNPVLVSPDGAWAADAVLRAAAPMPPPYPA